MLVFVQPSQQVESECPDSGIPALDSSQRQPALVTGHLQSAGGLAELKVAADAVPFVGQSGEAPDPAVPPTSRDPGRAKRVSGDLK
jgi:hypothetical protein